MSNRRDHFRHRKWEDKWLEVNKKYSEIWPNISESKEPLPEHENIKMRKISLINTL